MKAVVLMAFGSADNFAVAQLPLPEVGAGDVRIRTKAVAFNPVNYQIRRGGAESGRARSMILGRDLSGIVDVVGDGVNDFSVGDEVYGYVCNLASTGTYAEYVSVPAELVARKPASLSFAQSAAVPVAAVTASIALDKTRAGSASSVFIAGGVGTFAIMLARQRGVRRLVTTAGNASSRAYLVEHCRPCDDDIVDYNDPQFVERAFARNGVGFEIVLDLVGGQMLSACCALLAVDGNLAPPPIRNLGALSAEIVRQAHLLLSRRRDRNRSPSSRYSTHTSRSPSTSVARH